MFKKTFKRTFERTWSSIICVAALAALCVAQGDTAQKIQAPDIAGSWSGTWGIYSPARGAESPKNICKQLDCKIESKDGVWQASFEGDCGRPYKYSIKMEGRQVGAAVLFKGTTDLGPKDGGVFDWIGRATDKEFVGFYTSASYTGVFSLTRASK